MGQSGGPEASLWGFSTADPDWRPKPLNLREWQRCPICMGSGQLWDVPLFPTRTKACHGCNGLGMVVRP